MTRAVKLFGLGLALAALGLALCSCPKNQTPGKTARPQKGEVQEELRRLELQYAILEKDAPPQVETLPFRQKVGEIEKAIKSGQYEKADSLAREAGVWLGAARERYYSRHRTMVGAGTGHEKGADLIAEAVAWADKGKAAKEQGDEWGSQQYYQAAMEQGELALLAAERNANQAHELIDLAFKMEEICLAAGKPERAAEFKEQVIQSLSKSVTALDQRIQQCLSGKDESCDKAVLSKDEAAVDKKAEELNELNRAQLNIAEQSQKLAPGRILANDESAAINAWTINWRVYFTSLLSPAKPIKEEPKDPGQEAKLRAELDKHNQLKAGAAPIRGSGITLEEAEVYINGDSVVIRGRISNFMNEALLQPKVTITGQIYSDLVDLGYESFKPLTTTTFQIEVKGFTAEAYAHALNNLPSHQLLLIYRDAKGQEKKLIQPVK